MTICPVRPLLLRKPLRLLSQRWPRKKRSVFIENLQPISRLLCHRRKRRLRRRRKKRKTSRPSRSVAVFLPASATSSRASHPRLKSRRPPRSMSTLPRLTSPFLSPLWRTLRPRLKVLHPSLSHRRKSLPKPLRLHLQSPPSLLLPLKMTG